MHCHVSRPTYTWDMTDTDYNTIYRLYTGTEFNFSGLIIIRYKLVPPELQVMSNC